MRIWALSDLHLSLGSDKPMDIFGDHWVDHHQRMANAWDTCVADDDVVLTPGDFSWAGKPDAAQADFAWLGERPGFKVLVKGNHDHWWPKSKTKLANLLPEKTYALKKTACIIGNVGFFGARGGDFAPLTRYGDTRSQADIDTALAREEHELGLSIAQLDSLVAETDANLALRICCFHYPPIPPGRTTSRFANMISAAAAAHCIYGHLHGSEVGPAKVEGTHGDVTYRCASCDQIDFTPMLVADLSQNAEH